MSGAEEDEMLQSDFEMQCFFKELKLIEELTKRKGISTLTTHLLCDFNESRGHKVRPVRGPADPCHGYHLMAENNSQRHKKKHLSTDPS